jgi:hypothetical protein
MLAEDMTQTARMQVRPAPPGRSGPMASRARPAVAPRASHAVGQAAARVARRPASSADALAGLLARCVAGGCCCGLPEQEESEVVAREVAAIGPPVPAATDALGARLQRSVAARPGRQMVARVSMKDCCNDWKDCLRSDKGRGAGVATEWGLSIAVDRESTKNLPARVKAGAVGHTWLKLWDNTGTSFSYGMWPQTGFDPSHPFSSVKGCLHHPDVAHEPPKATDYKETSYKVTEENFQKALDYAQDKCKVDPDYNLMSYNCTTFAIEAAQAAGVTPPSSSTMGIHNPNALYDGIVAEELKPQQGRGRAVAQANP